jgi:antitoxin component YwqK of YwqJK toxin-antitoxin module
MKNLTFLILSLLLYSCINEEEEYKREVKAPEILVEIEDGIFTEYYPGKKQIKFQGEQDDELNRHGRWVFYGENGLELSISHYIHGKKDGFCIVKYPNGVLHYVGEYSDDKKVGVWKTYNEKGELVTEKDFGK